VKLQWNMAPPVLSLGMVQDEAVPAMNGALEKLQAFFHGFYYERALNAAPTSVLKVYADAANHVFEQDDGWKRFRAMVKELSMAFALVVPLPEAEAITPHLAFFQRIQAMIRKRLVDERGSSAPAADRSDSQHRADQPRAEQEVPRST
jgi:type I restriction enzyme, R subunit